MTQRVEAPDQISLNGVRYPIEGPIRVSMATTQAPRMLIGASSKDTHPDISAVVWNDFRGGIGIDVMDGVQDVNRAWWSELQLRHKGQLVLPPLVTATAASGVSGAFDVDIINEYDNVIYAAFGTDLRSYNSTTDAWANVRTLNNRATNAINIFMGGTEYLVIATTAEYDYYNGSAWARSTSQKTKYLAFWDDRLWGIDNTGQLWWATTLGTEVDDAQLPIENGAVTNLFVARAPSGHLTLYAATTKGLFAHDLDTQRFVKTELELPFHPDNGLGATTWRDAAYISSGLSIYRYVNGSNAATISVVGPDRDHGLPADYRGRVRRLIPTLNGLIALIDATSATTLTSIFIDDGVPSNSEVISPDAGRSAILEWDGQGWQVLWTGAADTLPVTVAHVANAYNDYRLWWAQNQRIYWMKLNRDIVNPSQTSDKQYAASASHETPWFDADEDHIEKTAIVVCTHTISASSNETIAVRMRLNDDDASGNQTTLGTITSAGHGEFMLPDTTTRTGTAYRTIKFVLDLARGSTVTNTPDLDRLEFYFVRREEIRWGVSATLDIPPEGYGLQSAEEMQENLLAATASSLLVQVSWRDRDADDAGATNPLNYYMNVTQFTGTEFTGNDFSGEYTLVMVERDGSHR